MANEHVVAARVDHAVRTAHVDPEAAREPRDERVQFDPQALQAVLDLVASAQDVETVCQMTTKAMRAWVDGRDVFRALAALKLHDHILTSTQRRSYRETESGLEPL